jgi:thioredoxin reductase (NADPH)
MTDWDVAVIGGGPAGLSAAAIAASLGLSCLVIDRTGGGGELMNLGALHEIDEALTGPELAARLLEEAVAAGAELVVAEVTGLAHEESGWRVSTEDDLHRARAVILTVGLAPGRLDVNSEADFEGRGLSHCAACDGPLYRGEPVVVAGDDRWARQEARDLTVIASSVTLVTQADAPPPAAEAFAVIRGRITALEGVSGLEAVLVQVDGGATRRLPARAVFVQTGRRPALALAPEILARDPAGRVVTGTALQTNMDGLFAAGDVRAGTPGTLAAAMAEGRRAAEAARAMLSPLGSPFGSPFGSPLGKDAD